MSNSDSTFIWKPGESSEDRLIRKLEQIRYNGLKAGLDDNYIKSFITSELEILTLERTPVKNKLVPGFSWLFILCLLILALSIFLSSYDFRRNRCTIENNYLVMEITRPITECSICKGVDSFRIMKDVSKEEFAKYAYLGQPMLVKGGCANWKAIEKFNYNFFKKIYTETKGAYQSVEEECQFFPFKTDFLSLEEVFNMSESRAKLLEGERTWYIGWSNCNPDISAVLRELYSRPYFLPDDSELSAIDWIFMGYAGQGASMHLDYVQRPSWQAQIAGSKTWYLEPPPECEHVCHSMNITVQTGDIILIDTNQWYHTTFIEGKEMSITLGSEYD